MEFFMITMKFAEYKKGAILSLPIAMGYLPVSFSFGMLAVSAGVDPVWAIVISMTNLTSAGQFAGVNIIGAGGGALEIALTTLVINLRYMLMSLALTQKMRFVPFGKQLITAAGVTDEIFAVASTTENELSFSFMMGLISVPYMGWTLGTALGAYVNNLLPASVASAMGITLYAMFIAIIIPAAKRDKKIIFVIAAAVMISCVFYFLIPAVSSGWAVIIAAVLASALGASLFPRRDSE